MTARNGIEIDGIVDVQNMLENLAPRDARNINRATIHAVASEITKGAKERAPRDEGTLRRALKTKRRRPKHPDTPFSDVMAEHGNDAKNDAFYWFMIEYGTVQHPERPFIRPAIAEVKGNITAIYKRKFGEKLAANLKRKANKLRRG